MALSKERKGEQIARFTCRVERGKIGEFCRAIGERNPIYFDREAAIAAGFEDVPVPLTFATVFQFWGYETLWEDMRSIGIDTDRLLHVREEYRYLRPIYPGTVVEAEVTIADVKTGKLEMVTFVSDYSDQTGVAISARMTIMIPPAGHLG